MQAWIEVIGRFHPVLLHTPLGVMAGVAALEGLQLVKKGDGWVGAVRVLALILAGSAAVAAASGLILSYEPGYGGETLDRHLKLGIVFSLLCIVYALFAIFGKGGGSAAGRRVALVAALLVMVPTGHLGGSMTHGEDFLFAPLHKKGKGEGEAVGGKPATEFEVSVRPVLEATCYACHGESKAKGGLALHNRENLEIGGDSGHVWEAGNAAVSLMVKRMRLPIEDEDHMPPDGKPQPTEEQIRAIEAWINAGASFDAPARELAKEKVAGGAETKPVERAGEKAAAIEGPRAEDVAALKEVLAHVEPVSRENPRLVVSFAAVAPTVDDRLVSRVVGPVAKYVEELTLARTKVGDESVKLAAGMPHLRKLDVSGTGVTTAGLAVLKGHGELRELVVTGVRLEGKDGEVTQLVETMPKLERVYVWESGLKEETVAELRRRHPAMVVDAGDRGTTEKLATEGELKFTSDAPPPGQAPVAAVAADLKPINTVCPVSGAPIKPEYQILYKGKVIGFCCPNCPKTFWENPEAFLSKLK